MKPSIGSRLSSNHKMPRNQMLKIKNRSMDLMPKTKNKIPELFISMIQSEMCSLTIDLTI